jgi:Uma2 family endonuclease
MDYDQGVKLEAYAVAEVPEYAVVNPAERTLTHYRLLEPGRYDDSRAFSGDEVVVFDCLPGLSAPVSALFVGAPDTTL